MAPRVLFPLLLLSACAMPWQSTIEAFSSPSTSCCRRPRAAIIDVGSRSTNAAAAAAAVVPISPRHHHGAIPAMPSPSSSSALYYATTTNNRYHHHYYSPVFDFTEPNSSTKAASASSFERIDDAIMGGISTSSLRDVPSESYASWSGVCRTDGGGFCGMRTLPFADNKPLNATGAEGVFLECKLASDDEPGRRVWKMTVRTDTSRGEMVYQAEYDLKKALDEAATSEGEEGKDDGWATVEVPFDEFRQVRGPRLVPDGPKLDVTGGIYQIGMTLSKFVMAENTTELEDFRPGFFDMRIRRIGFFHNSESDSDDNVAASDMASATPSVPETLSKEEAQRKRPLLLKMLLPIAKIFFSEQANRRKSAMRILREERGMGRGKAILYGIRTRRGSRGLVQSVAKTLGILSIDAFRSVVASVLKVVIVYPLRIVGALVRMVKQMLGLKVKPSLRE